MFLRLPQSIPLPFALASGFLIAAAQIIEGTAPGLALGSFAFILLSVVAFNMAGGLAYPSGAYIASCASFTVILGIVAKVFLGEPFQRNLLTPERTMTVYVVGMASMLAAAWVTGRTRPRRALLSGMKLGANVNGVGFLCLLIGIFVGSLLPQRLAETFGQLNHFTELAILLCVYETVRRTNGRRSFNPIALVAWAFTVYLGLITFSKEGLFAGSAAWLLAAVAAGYRASVGKLLVIATAVVAALMILTPYSQVGRDLGRSMDASAAFGYGISLLSHPLELRDEYKADENELQATIDNYYHLYDKPEGLLDRLNMFAVDDALVQDTDRGDVASPANLWTYFINLIPRYLYPGKPIYHWGNEYAKPIGLAAPNDDTTGISFSPFADGYHTSLWMGVTIYSFGIFLFCFFICDAVAGSIEDSIWPLLYLLRFPHLAPEGLLGIPVYAAGTFTFFVVTLAFVCVKLLPAITNLFGKRPAAPGPSASYMPRAGRAQSV